MDEVFAALTCGAADKDKPAARMLPKGTTGRGGISNPPCMADAKEEMPKGKRRRMGDGIIQRRQRRKSSEKKNEEKSDRIFSVFFIPLFYKG